MAVGGYFSPPSCSVLPRSLDLDLMPPFSDCLAREVESSVNLLPLRVAPCSVAPSLDALNESDVMFLDPPDSENHFGKEEPDHSQSDHAELSDEIEISVVPEPRESGRDPLSSFKKIVYSIQQLRKWRQLTEGKGERTVPLPEDLLAGLISEFNLQASRFDVSAFKAINHEDIQFVLDCVGHQVVHGQEHVDSLSEKDDLSQDVMASLFASLEASLLAFTIFGCMDLPGQEDVRSPSFCNLCSYLPSQCVESILGFTKSLQRRFIFPKYDSMYQTIAGVAKVVHGEWSSDLDDSSEDNSVSSGRDKKPIIRRRNSRRAPSSILPLPPKDTDLTRMTFKLSDIYKTMSAVLSAGVCYPDTIALSAALSCLESFYVENILHLQLSSARVISCVFQKYSALRSSLLEELIVSWPKILRSDRVAQTARLSSSGNAQKNISPYHLLILEIVHACSGSSALSAWAHKSALLQFDPDQPAAAKPTSAPSLAHVGTFLSSKLAARYVVEQLFSRCGHGAAADSDFQLILLVFVEDMLAAMFNPEWPCAELILQICTERMVLVLKGQDANGTPAKMGVALKESCVSLLGDIIASVKKEAIMNESSATLFQSHAPAMAYSIDDAKTLCPACSKPWQQLFMICCDSCRRWFHGGCIALSEGTAPHTWSCDACLVVEQVAGIRTQASSVVAGARSKRPSKAKAKNRVPPIVPANTPTADLELLVAKKFIWMHLTERAFAYPSAADALQFLFSQWSVEAKHQHDTNLFMSWAVQNRQRSSQISLDSVRKLFSRLVLRHSIWSELMRPMSFILFALQDKDTRVRRASLRALRQILAIYPEWMEDKLVFNAIISRFLDNGISVREAALDIVGDFMISHAPIARQYYLPVATQINDAGISVRKRVVKIMKALLLSKESRGVIGLPDVCVRLSSRLRDDPLIKVSVMGMFTDMWIKGRLEPDRDGSPLLEAADFTVASRVDQILDVVAFSLSNSASRTMGDLSSMRWLVDIIKTALGVGAAAQGNATAKRLQQYRESMKRMSELLYSISLDDPPGPATQFGLSRRISAFAVLNLIAMADPSLLSPMIEQLAALLKTRELSKDWSHCLVHLCSTLELVIGFLASSTNVQPIVAAVEEDLVTIAHHFATNVVEKSLRTLCNIVLATRSRTDRIEQLYAESYSALKEDLRPKSPQASARVLRNLFCLGAICRFFVWPDGACRRFFLNDLSVADLPSSAQEQPHGHQSPGAQRGQVRSSR